MELFIKSLTNYLLGTSEEFIAQRASKLINKCENQEFDITFPSASKLDIWKKCIGKHENEIQFPHKFCHLVFPHFIHDFSVTDVGYPCSIPVPSYSLQKRLQGMQIACKTCKFEIPAR